MLVDTEKLAETCGEWRLPRNFMLIEVKLGEHYKICQQIVERRLETPQVTRLVVFAHEAPERIEYHTEMLVTL
jgi:hypothetical protein